MIELLTVNLRRKRQTSYELDAPRPVYILEKYQNVNRMAPHSVYILKKIVNRTRGIWFSIFFLKKIEDPFGHFYRDNFDILKTYGGE